MTFFHLLKPNFKGGKERKRKDIKKKERSMYTYLTLLNVYPKAPQRCPSLSFSNK